MDENESILVVFTLFTLFIVAFGIVNPTLSSPAAVSGNLTANAYSAYTTAYNTRAFFPLYGLLFWTTVFYVLLYQRHLLGKLLLGYFALLSIAAILFVLYVAFMSMPAILGLAAELIMLFGKLVIGVIVAIPRLIYKLFSATGESLSSIPEWIYFVFIASLPIAYYIGDRLQKYIK